MHSTLEEQTEALQKMKSDFEALTRTIELERSDHAQQLTQAYSTIDQLKSNSFIGITEEVEEQRYT